MAEVHRHRRAAVNHPCPQRRPGLGARYGGIWRRAGHGGPVQQGPDSTTSAERHPCPAWCLCSDGEPTPRRGLSCQSRTGSSKGERFLSAEPKSVFLTSFLLSSYFAPRATQGRSAHTLPGHSVGMERWCCDLPGDHLSPRARLRPLATEAASSWRDLKRRHLPGQRCVREEQETLPVTWSVTIPACVGMTSGLPIQKRTLPLGSRLSRQAPPAPIPALSPVLSRDQQQQCWPWRPLGQLWPRQLTSRFVSSPVTTLGKADIPFYR